jgi:Cu/Ag efflux pump CusA
MGVGRPYCADKLKMTTQIRRIFLDELAGLADLVTVPRADGAFYLLLRVHKDLDPMELVRQLIELERRDIVAELEHKLQIPGVRNGWTQPIINRINMLSTGVRTDIGFKIFGENLDTLEVYAIKAEGLLKKVDGAADVVAERVQNGYYLDIQIKREIAARYGVNISDLQNVIETAIGGQNLGVVIEGRMRFPIRML